jgi:GNAT superfamily N-acetyltransferase
MTASSSEPRSPAVPKISPQWRESLRDGTSVLIRAIQATDEGLERAFIERLSPQSSRYRFLGTIKTPSETLLTQFTHPELVRGVAYIATIGVGTATREIGVCRYSASPDGLSCECAVCVSDEWQGKGLATILMHRLIDTARERGIELMYSIDANDNQDMRELAEHLGFGRRVDPDDPTLVIHTLDMKPALK